MIAFDGPMDIYRDGERLGRFCGYNTLSEYDYQGYPDEGDRIQTVTTYDLPLYLTPDGVIQVSSLDGISFQAVKRTHATRPL